MSGALDFGPGLEKVTITSLDPTLFDRAHSGRTNRRKLEGQRWLLSCVWPELKTDEFWDIYAFLVAQRGRYETFTIIPPVEGYARGVASGTPVVRNRQNLLLYSEQFDNAAWSAVRVSVTPNAATDPNGASTADKLIPDTSASTHNLKQSTTIASGDTVVFSCYFKDAGYHDLQLIIGDSTPSVFYVFLVDLSAVTITPSSTAGGFTSGGASIVSVGSGWYRCSIVVGTVGITSCFAFIRPHGSAAGDGTSGIYAWGAQLEVHSSVGPYVQTMSAAVNTEAQSGSSVYVGGWTPNVTGILKAGDFLGFAGHTKAYMNKSTVNSDSSGIAQLSLTSPLIAALADGEALTVNGVPFTVSAAADAMSFDHERGLYRLSAAFEEDL